MTGPVEGQGRLIPDPYVAQGRLFDGAAFDRYPQGYLFEVDEITVTCEQQAASDGPDWGPVASW